MTKDLEPQPTQAWRVLHEPCMLVAPVAGWRAESPDKKDSILRFLCQTTRTRMVTVTHQTTARGNTVTFARLVPTETPLDSLVPVSKHRFYEEVQKIGVDTVEELDLSGGANQDWLNSKEFVQDWGAWCQQNSNLRFLSTVSVPKSAVLAAGLLQESSLRNLSEGYFGPQLLKAIEEGDIPLEDPACGPVLADLLGSICDTLEDGPKDLARFFRRAAGKGNLDTSREALSLALDRKDPDTKEPVLGPIVQQLFKQYPIEGLEARQSAIDQFFRSDPSYAELVVRCGIKDPFQGPLPVRFSVAQMVTRLLSVSSLNGLLDWAHDEPLTA